jgi:ankyrin repeat protein
MNLPREHVIPMLDHDHRQICKYPSTDSKGMRLVLDELKRAIGLATTTPVDGVTGAAQLATNTAKRLREGNLLRAVVTGDLGAVSRLIQSGINCDVYDSNHNTALHIACQQNHLDIGIYLLQHGAPVNARNDYEDHPLHLAVKNCVGLVLAIIEHGGDLNAQNIDGNTPLHHAASAGDTHLVTQLLEHGADWSIRNEANESPARLARKALKLDAMKALHHAAEKSQQVMVLASVDRRVAGDDLTRDEQQAVSATRSLPSASFLSMDMDVEIKKQASELATAARRGDLAAVEDMLDNGVKPTPHVLYLAADGCRSDVVEILVDIMEDIDSGVGWAGNALCAAACRADGHNTLRVLLEKGADINWQGGTYGCALQAATVNYRLENVKLLLMYGADVHAQCGHYGNALTAAARHRTSFEDMATLLLELGVDIDAQGPGVYGNALQTAVYKFHVPNVKFLLHHGANAKVQGRFGSAIDIARRNLTKDGYIGNREEKEEILFLLTEDELDSLAIID